MASAFWRRLDRPAVLFPLAAALFAGVVALTPDLLLFERAPLFGLSPVWVTVVYFGAVLAVVAVARLAPVARDPVHLALGLGWFYANCGWRMTAGALAVALIVFVIAQRIHPHLAMVVAAVLLLVGARFAFGELPESVPAQRRAAEAMLRLVYFAFEVRAIRRSRRSVVSMLAYAPFGLLLWPGPVLLSHLTYTTERPRAELDRMAARQLVTFSAKLLALYAVWIAVERLLPPIATFGAQPFAIQLVMILPAYVVFYLHTARQDLAAAFANFAGHYTPSPFHFPLLASNPVDYFRRWNVHVVEFIRRAFIYPVARRVRSVILIALSAMAGSALFHLFLRELGKGPRMDWQAVAQTPILIHFVVGLLLALTLPMFSRRGKPLPLAAHIVLIIGTQFALAAFTFAQKYSFIMGQPLPGGGWCLLFAIVDRGRACQP